MSGPLQLGSRDQMFPRKFYIMGYNLKNARNGKSTSKIPKWYIHTSKLKPRFGLRVNCGRHVARLHHRRRRRRRRRRAYAPTSNTASHDTHEKISSWVPFSFLIWVWGSAWRPSAAGAPLIRVNQTRKIAELARAKDLSRPDKRKA